MFKFFKENCGDLCGCKQCFTALIGFFCNNNDSNEEEKKAIIGQPEKFRKNAIGDEDVETSTLELGQ